MDVQFVHNVDEVVEGFGHSQAAPGSPADVTYVQEEIRMHQIPSPEYEESIPPRVDELR